MARSGIISKIYKKSFIANVYTTKHFRMIGLIDVDIRFNYGTERVTLAYYSSSGTNGGKIQGLWYPIIGIKSFSGPFTEFSSYANSVLTQTSSKGMAHKGWLAKSLFFYGRSVNKPRIRGFSNTSYYNSLLEVGLLLKNLYETNQFQYTTSLTPKTLNMRLYAKNVYASNTHSQHDNFDYFIYDIFTQSRHH